MLILRIPENKEDNMKGLVGVKDKNVKQVIYGNSVRTNKKKGEPDFKFNKLKLAFYDDKDNLLEEKVVGVGEDGGTFSVSGASYVIETPVYQEGGKLYILNDRGGIAGTINEGVRIFSRPDTKEIIKKSKKASASQSRDDFKDLGLAVMKMIIKQNNREPEFVES